MPFLDKATREEAKNLVRKYGQRHGEIPKYSGLNKPNQPLQVVEPKKKKTSNPRQKKQQNSPSPAVSGKKKRKHSSCLVVGLRFLLIKTFGMRHIMEHNTAGKRSRGVQKSPLLPEDKKKLACLTGTFIFTFYDNILMVFIAHRIYSSSRNELLG